MSKLLFVCGFPSGGTDLTKTVLNAHPQIYLNGEMPLLKNLRQAGYDDSTIFSSVEEIGQFQAKLKTLNTWNNMENLDHDFSQALAAQQGISMEEVLRLSFSEKEREIWGNKTPQNTENISTLAALFPEAYFLIVVRDVRDVCLSWRNKWGKDELLCASKWAQRMRLGWESAQQLPHERYLFLHFEELLSATEAACRELCAFLQIPFSDRMLQHQKFTPEKIDGKINYGRPIIADNQKKWQTMLSEDITRRIEEISFETLNLFDYTPAYASQARPITDVEKTAGLLRDLKATLFVGNRSSKSNTFGRRVKDLAWELKKRV